MANHATFGFDGSVLEGKRPSLIGMAGKADLVLSRGRAQLASQESAMWVMAVAAGNQSFVDAMVEGLGEVRFGLKMAAVTQLRLALP
jgi:hypothetical protein